MREIGRNLYAWSFAHTVKVDRYDNIWATDKGSDMVIKFDPDGRVVMVFGRKQEASDEGTGPLKHPNPPLPPEDGRFRQVTDVAWDSDDNAYISDGYINSRVAKVNRRRRLARVVWNARNRARAVQYAAQHRDRFTEPHLRRGSRQPAHPSVRHARPFVRQIHVDVAYDPNARPAIGDRPSGAALQGTQGPGSPWAICISPPPHEYLYSSDAYPGRIYKMTLDGQILGVSGNRESSSKQFGWVHEMACPAENVLLVAEILNWRVQKLILHPT